MPKTEPTARDLGLGAALEIQQRADPRQWRARVDAIEDPAVRAVAEQYLRDMLTRMRTLRQYRASNDNRRR